MLAALTRTLEHRDPGLRDHAVRVTTLAERVAVRLGWDARRLAGLKLGGALHDVGKLHVTPRILRKAGPLSPVELAEVRRHPTHGARLLAGFGRGSIALPYVLHHHERWDGRGYPYGLRGAGIPLEARVLAVADAFDAMTSSRPYRPALERTVALEEVERCAGSQFDPRVAAAFLEVWGP